MIQSLSERLSRFAHRWVPDPLVLSVLLTALTLSTASLVGQAPPSELIWAWGGAGGLWKLLAFSMQMCLILVTGHALGVSPPVQRLIHTLASRPSSQSAAITLTALSAMSAALVNWGFGVIVGALMAREVGRSCAQRGVRVHYPLLGAAGYTGMLVWHGGLSGSAPLKVTQASDLAELSVAGGVITLEQTLASPLNLTLNLALLALVPLLLTLMSPPEEARQGFELVKGRGVSTHTQPEPPSEAQPTTPAERLERSAWLSKGLALIMLSYLALYATREGLSALDLNTINLLLLALGLTAHPHLKAYEEATHEAVKGCAGIILQFPLYAGVMGVMAGAGLTTALSTWVTSVASAESLSPLVFLSAGLVNLFVPSGGGQWALQGPLVIESARALEANVGEAVMAFSYGDAWTNMLQPFWALPLLGLTGLKAKELVGYSAALMLLVTPLYLLLFWLF